MIRNYVNLQVYRVLVYRYIVIILVDIILSRMDKIMIIGRQIVSINWFNYF